MANDAQGSPGPNTQYQPSQYNVLAIVGFVLAFVYNIAGLVVSIIALNQLKQSTERGKGLALSGVIVGGASLIFSIVFAVLIFTLFANEPSASGF